MEVLLVWNRASGCHRTNEALSFSRVQRSLVLVESLIPPPSPLFPFKVLTDFATNLSKLSNLYPTFWPGLRFTNIRYHSFIFQQIFLIQIANWLQQTAEFQPWWILALCQDTLKFSFFLTFSLPNLKFKLPWTTLNLLLIANKPNLLLRILTMLVLCFEFWPAFKCCASSNLVKTLFRQFSQHPKACWNKQHMLALF